MKNPFAERRENRTDGARRRSARRKVRPPLPPEALEARLMMDSAGWRGGLATRMGAVVERPGVAAPQSIVIQTPGDSSRQVEAVFHYLGRFARYRSEMGLFRVDDAQGSVDGLLPGDRKSVV